MSTFRVWAPAAAVVELELRGERRPMVRAGEDWVADVAAAHGDRYRFVVDGEALPDPCSRWQPDGLRGPSAVVGPLELRQPRRPVALTDLVVYELHVGTFTAQGTLDTTIDDLGRLAALGITAVELMPVADFPGERGWGYDGVFPYAVHRAYGGPAAMARFVDAAHARGLAVILDVVFNHVGASGEETLAAYGPYFTDRHETFWGEAVDFSQRGVREWACGCAEMWVSDYGMDGLRLDAVHAIHDESDEHVVAELTRRVHALGGLVIAEAEHDHETVLGWGCDAVWFDDLHHAVHTLLTGESEGYYSGFGRVKHLVRALTAHRDEPQRYVVCAQNHDQVGNRAVGDRLPEALRPLAAFCVLCSPYTPLLFMGEEYGETAPFQYFTDHIDAKLAVATREGRRREFAAFAGFSEQDVPDPEDPVTFERSRLGARGDASLYVDLLRQRREIRGPARVLAEGRDWLVVARDEHRLLMNFATEPRAVPHGGEVVLAAGGMLRDGLLDPLTGVLVR